MTRCPNIQHCSVCQEPLIHKANRSRHESSSLLGQAIHDLCPSVFTFMDIDGALYRRSIRLLRILEHKSPGQHRNRPQQELLVLLAKLIDHAKHCPGGIKELGLHKYSGAYLIEGDPQKGNQLGPSRITNILTKRSREMDELNLLSWLPLLEREYVEYIWQRLSHRSVA